MEKPLISIIVPVYKVEKYLERCVNSIINQTYKNFEIILIDDGSPDQCGDICDAYAKKDNRIHVIHQENGGLSAARNSGIDWAFSNSKSEFLTFIDSDDWIHPQYLEILLDTSKKYAVPVSICALSRVDEYDNRTLQPILSKSEVEITSAEDLLVNHQWNFNYAVGKLYQKCLFKEIRYPEGKNFEDVFTTYKVLFAVEKVALVNCELYFYYKNELGITRSPWTPDELVIFEGMHNQMNFYREHGYLRALEKEEYLYVNHFAYQICRIRENKNDLKQNRHYVKSLRKEMMKMLHQNPKKYGYRQIPYCYEVAYPIITRFYCALRSIKYRFIKR